MFFRDPGGSGGPSLFTVDISGRNELRVPTPGFASDPRGLRYCPDGNPAARAVRVNRQTLPKPADLSGKFLPCAAKSNISVTMSLRKTSSAKGKSTHPNRTRRC